MTDISIKPGCIFHWEDYRFEDGETGDKFFVILGAKVGCNYLCVMATSQKHHKKFDYGCNSNDSYYFIPGGKDGFKLDTWLLLYRAIELSPAEFLKLCLAKTVEIKKEPLRENIANAIRNCLKYCRDVNPLHVSLL